MTHRIFTTFAAVLFSAGPVLADEVTYRSVWHQDQVPGVHTAPLSLSNFLGSGQELAESGLVLIDAETQIINGVRTYAGLWAEGTGATFFTAPMGPVAFREEIITKRAEGLRLVDFEIFRNANGGRRYIGVWRNGTGDQRLTGPMQQDAFFARGERLTAEGLRLIDVEAEMVNGTLLYHGLFRTGSGDNFLTAPQRADPFRDTRDAQVAAGRELVDMERIETAQGGRFIGVWSSGPGESRISRPRAFGAHFIFAQDQFNNDKHAVDFEIRVVADDTVPDRGDSNALSLRQAFAALPQNPANVVITDDLRLRVIWSQDSDNPFTIEYPRSAIPGYLPQDENGDYVLPDTYCGLEVTRAHDIFWQTFNDDAVETPPFLQEDVSELGSDFFLGGVHFAGPFGSCTDAQEEWNFPFPFTENAADFEVLENLSLTVELEQGSELRFLPAGPPDAPHFEADELFEASSEETLEDLLEAFADLFGEGQDPNAYCESVGQFWTVMCTTTSGPCPDVVATLPDCD